MERSAIRDQHFSIRGSPDFASLHPGYEDAPRDDIEFTSTTALP
jgi:hypothetical protein